jgi:hypothetical protein
LGVGVGAGELELDLALNLLEAFPAAELWNGGAEETSEQTMARQRLGGLMASFLAVNVQAAGLERHS